MKNPVIVGMAVVGMMYVVACSSTKSSVGTQDPAAGPTVSSVPQAASGTQAQALTGQWGLVDFSCASGHALSPLGSTIVQAKSTIVTFNNGVMRVYSTLGSCSFVNYNVVAVSGDQLIYRGGQAYGKKSCQGMAASKQGISSDSSDSFAIQDSGNQLVLRSSSSGDICPQGDTIVATYGKLAEL